MKYVTSVSLAVAAGGLLAQGALAGPGDGVRARGGPLSKDNPVIKLPVWSGDGPGFSENFDSYANGSGIVGQNNWLYWGSTGQVDATVDNALAASAPNSLLAAVETDVVQVFDITSGKWRVKVKTYYPSTQTAIGYFIMLNTYSNPYVSGGNWSVEFSLNGATNLVTNTRRTVSGTNTTLPLIKDEWVEFVLEIDLDNDSFTATYGGQTLVEPPNNKWSQHASAGTLGVPRIQCIDLYSSVAGLRWDDLVVESISPPTCYPNCDGSTIVPILNVSDFICFQTRYAANDTYANCDGSTTPPILNVSDFICFQTAYSAGCS